MEEILLKAVIYCRSQKELVNYLEELITYFNQYGRIPVEEGFETIPEEAVVRIRFDEDKKLGSVKISINW